MKIQFLRKDYCIYLILTLILLMLAARTAFGVSIHPVLILFAAIIPSFFATESQLVAMVVSFLALGTGFQYKYALLLYLIIGIFRFYHRLRISKLIFPVAMMMVWELLHSITGTMFISEYFRQFAELLFLVFVASLKWENVNYKVIAR